MSSLVAAGDVYVRQLIKKDSMGIGPSLWG